MATKLTIGFLGAGKMATALASGFVNAQLITGKQLTAADPFDAARKNLPPTPARKLPRPTSQSSAPRTF
jgi:pyrroline-5-carboxylate reductase